MKNLEDYEQIKVAISDKGDTIHCTLEVPAVCSHFPHRVEIGSDAVEQILSRKGYKFHSLLQGGNISNKSETSKLRETWVFCKKQPQSKKPAPPKITKVTKRRTSRSKIAKE